MYKWSDWNDARANIKNMDSFDLKYQQVSLNALSDTFEAQNEGLLKLLGLQTGLGLF